MKKTALDFLFDKLWDTPKDKFTWHSILKSAKAMDKKNYSEEDFIEFSQWVSANQWFYVTGFNYWINLQQKESETAEKFTTKELLYLFETSKKISENFKKN